PSRRARSAARSTGRSLAPSGSRRAAAGRRQALGLHRQLPALDPPLSLEQGPRRRAAGDGPVLVVHAAVARAEEELRLRAPVDRTAEVGAVDVEHLEAAHGEAADPERGLGGLAGPEERARIVELHEGRGARGESRDVPDRNVRVGLALEERRDEVADDRKADETGDRGRKRDRDAREEPPPIHQPPRTASTTHPPSATTVRTAPAASTLQC